MHSDEMSAGGNEFSSVLVAGLQTQPENMLLQRAPTAKLNQIGAATNSDDAPSHESEAEEIEFEEAPAVVENQ